MSLSGNSLTTSTDSEIERLTNYLYGLTYNAVSDFSISLRGTIASAKIDGIVSYTIITPSTGNDFVSLGNPTAGELHITTTADSSQAWLIAQADGINVEIDTDGNGTVDSIVMTTWPELQAL